MRFTVSRIEAHGDGLWRKALQITRDRLDADGLLAPERKRPLPAFPRTIAVITSPDGAAFRDIAAVIRRRGMGVRLVVIPAAVQGENAPAELRAALKRLARWRGADVVIIGRGGGSREDLWAFNDERLARAVAACPIPTISAVGHEIDMSICDLVADVRAPTPSAAAEVVTRSQEELRAMISQLGNRLRRNARAIVSEAGARVRGQGRSLTRASATVVDRRQAQLRAISGRLHALSPLATLARGYALPRSLDGRTLASVGDFVRGAEFDLVVHDGSVRSRVTETPTVADG
jgi:exodeoxyribonuclease VII large subunit